MMELLCHDWQLSGCVCYVMIDYYLVVYVMSFVIIGYCLVVFGMSCYDVIIGYYLVVFVVLRDFLQWSTADAEIKSHC